MLKFIKKCIPYSIRAGIKYALKIPTSLPFESAIIKKMSAKKSGISVLLSGGIGDFIVILNIVDQISAMCGDNDIYIYTDRPKQARSVSHGRPNVTIRNNFIAGASHEVVFSVELIINTFYVNKRRLKKYPQKFINAIKLLMKYSDSMIQRIADFPIHFRIPIILRQARVKGLNRWTILNSGGAFDMSKMRSAVYLDMYDYKTLNDLGLENKDYITINYGADKMRNRGNQTKVWLFEHYEKFVELFKAKYPDILVVQVGADDENRISAADVYAFNLKFGETGVILKNSAAHIDSEGGLVHYSTQLSTKCVVCFGPTPLYFYSYPQNKNLIADGCTDCMFVHDDWYTVCHKDGNHSCMKNILPEQVLEAVDEIFAEKNTYKYEIVGSAIYSSVRLERGRTVIDKIAAHSKMTLKDDNGHIFGPCKTYIHASKRWEYPYIIDAIEKHGKELKIADVGGGRGALSLYLASLNHDVSVYDIDYNCDNEGDRFCNNKFLLYCADNNVKAQYGSVFNVPDDDDTFDVVVSCSVIEHILYKEYALLEMLRVLKPGGILVMTYDLKSGNDIYSDDKRAETFTPKLIEETLFKAGIKANIHTNDEVRESILEFSNDKIAMDMTVGGLIIKKRG